MCGICGIYNIENNHEIEEPILVRMQESIRHRGPDESRIFLNSEVGFGFCRLSFIDITGGMQPIQNENNSITMICNGEIYNHIELRKKLENLGHIFKTRTDTEVVLHLYEEYGLDFPQYLNGQFALAIYDENRKRLVLIRDHMGVAPLFYTMHDGRLIFASEIKAILEYPGVKRKLNLTAIDQLLTYPGPISPTTFFEDIFSLENGHYLTVEDGQLKNQEYWDVCYQVESKDMGEDYYIEKLRDLMVNSIHQRLMADVPIGFYISGGLDSAIIASFIQKYIPGSYSSFSAEFPDEEYSEREFQRIVQQYVNSKHYSVVVQEESLWQEMKNVLYHSETPLKETYDVAAYLLSGLVKNSPVKAILTGQGADEFFNGYIGYKFDFIREHQKGNMTKEDCEINERLWGNPYFQYEKGHYEYEKVKRNLYSDNLKDSISKFSAIQKSPINLHRVKDLNSQRRRSYIDYKLRLTDHLLADHGDRMCFANSVEGRHPFLDRSVIDFALEIPEKYKLAGSNEKYILKKMAKGIVPDEIIHRRKFPFRAPGMPDMLKKHVDLVDLYMNDNIIKKQGIFDVKYINELKTRYTTDQFKLNIPYESDYLTIVLTVTMFNEIFNVSI